MVADPFMGGIEENSRPAEAQCPLPGFVAHGQQKIYLRRLAERLPPLARGPAHTGVTQVAAPAVGGSIVECDEGGSARGGVWEPRCKGRSGEIAKARSSESQSFR